METIRDVVIQVQEGLISAEEGGAKLVPLITGRPMRDGTVLENYAQSLAEDDSSIDGTFMEVQALHIAGRLTDEQFTTIQSMVLGPHL